MKAKSASRNSVVEIKAALTENFAACYQRRYVTMIIGAVKI
jgi:hypothetical protein